MQSTSRRNVTHDNIIILFLLLHKIAKVSQYSWLKYWQFYTEQQLFYFFIEPDTKQVHNTVKDFNRFTIKLQISKAFPRSLPELSSLRFRVFMSMILFNFKQFELRIITSINDTRRNLSWSVILHEQRAQECTRFIQNEIQHAAQKPHV